MNENRRSKNRNGIARTSKMMMMTPMMIESLTEVESSVVCLGIGLKYKKISPQSQHSGKKNGGNSVRRVVPHRCSCSGYFVSRISGNPSFPPTMITFVFGEFASFSVASIPFHVNNCELSP